MRIKRLVVASLVAAGLAVSGTISVAQPPPPECRACLDNFVVATQLCRTLPGPLVGACIDQANDAAKACLNANGCFLPPFEP